MASSFHLLHLRRLRIAALALVSLTGAGVSSASADLVYLTSGRTLSVKAVTYQGDQALLTLRMGGEVLFERTLIARVEPDEVPYPEPVPEPDPSAAVAASASALPASGYAAETALMAPPAIPQAFDELVTSLSKRHGVDARLVHAVITVESAYQPRARSAKGARGLMQLMPATARQYGVRNSYNVAANLEAGIKHLRSLLDRFELKLALAAYNAGEGTVQKFGGVPPYRETRDYVTKVLRLSGLGGARTR